MKRFWQRKKTYEKIIKEAQNEKGKDIEINLKGGVEKQDGKENKQNKKEIVGKTNPSVRKDSRSIRKKKRDIRRRFG